MEAIVTTDWHLDVLNNLYKHDPEQGIKLQIKDIEKSFDYALANGIKNLIVAGDLGQHCELSSLAKFHLLSLLMKYDGILNIHIIPGNHDYNRVGVHSLKLLELLCHKHKFESVHLYVEPTTVSIQGKSVHFIPFPYTKGVKGVINVAHLDPNGARRDNGRKITNGHDLDDDSFWVIGHIHTHQHLGHVVLPGTLYQCNFGESLPKGFIHLKAKKTNKAEFIEVKPSFTFNTVVIEDQDDWTKISKKADKLYRIYVQQALTVPDEIYQYTNVIQISGNIEEHEKYESEESSGPLEVIEDDDELLSDYLKQAFGLNRGQIKRSMALVQKAKQIHQKIM